jgi:hypothetical protein
VFWYLFWVVFGLGTYAAFAAVDSPVRDAAAFASAGNSPQGLRAYLLDDRNTAHRQEALDKLAALYDAPVERIRTGDKADPVLREGMAKLVDTLRGPEPPVVTIRVTNAAANNPKLAEFELKNLQDQLGDGIAQVVGTDHIRFLVPEEGENPHLDVVVTVTTVKSVQKITCDVSVRLKPDGDVVVKKSIESSPPLNPAEGIQFPGANDPVTRARTTVLVALVGEARGAPPPVIDDDSE